MSVFLDAPHDMDSMLRAALERVGLRLTRREWRAEVVLVARNGSPGAPKAPTERDSAVQLALVVGATGGRVGPLTRPGLTTCPGCVAAHESQRERIRALSPVAHPDPAQLQLLAALAAAELLRCTTPPRSIGVAGPDPLTSSAVLEVPDTGVPVRVPLPRHPHCGCTWADFLSL